MNLYWKLLIEQSFLPRANRRRCPRPSALERCPPYFIVSLGKLSRVSAVDPYLMLNIDMRLQKLVIFIQILSSHFSLRLDFTLLYLFHPSHKPLLFIFAKGVI